MFKKLFAFLAVTLVAASVATAQIKDYNWDVNVPIPDSSTAGPGMLSDTQTVPDSGTIADVNVDLLIEHTWQGDLIVDISHGGVTVPLMYRSGDSQSTSFGFSADNFGDPANPSSRFILDDEAGAFYDSAPPNGIGAVADPGIANVSGSWLPFGVNGASALSAFDGLDKNGPWILSISDNAGGDTGTLLSWSLHIENVPEPGSFLLLAFSGLGALALRRRI